MTDSIAIEAANLIFPLLNTATKVRQGAIAVTTTTGGGDIGALLTKAKDGHFITLFADGGDVYFAFNNSAAGTLDETATGTGVTVCQKLPSGQFVSGRLVDNFTFIRVKTASGTATLRYALSSKSMGQHARDI